MDKLTTPHTFLTLEDFYLQHQNITSEFLGRAAQSAWALKDMSLDSNETLEVCRRLQNKIKDKVGNRPAQWVLEVEESHVLVDFDAWIENSLAKSMATQPPSCGYPDLDLNIETQRNCGTQLEEFHSGEWAKAQLKELFDFNNFTPIEEPLEFHFEHSLHDLLFHMDKDLDWGVRGGMRSPYKCSVSVGALNLRLLPHEGQPEETIPVIRRLKVSDLRTVLDRLQDEIKARHEYLVGAIQTEQGNLKNLPEDWPTPEIYADMQKWATTSFTGDRGLMGSDLFEGNWIITELPSDIHRRIETPELSNEISNEVSTEVIADAKSELKSTVAQTSGAQASSEALAEPTASASKKVEASVVQAVLTEMDSAFEAKDLKALGGTIKTKAAAYRSQKAGTPSTTKKASKKAIGN